ncbi:hypothetical protein GTZ85_01195 [Streptomyces sp. SID5474]|nr:hypothetical protein [Streptomyces sp. SID5474]
MDAFFTIANAGQGAEQTGFVVQGNRVARYGWVSGRMLDGSAIRLDRLWPLLPTAFRAGFDATLTTPAEDPWTWVFRGDRCLRLHPIDGTVAEESTIAARFPGLPPGFASGIDAALPGPTGSQVFLFRADQCVLYDSRIPAVVETKSLAEMWSGLQAKAPAFVNGINAATYDPSSGEFHFFRGAQYTKGVLATRTVTLAATPIDDTSWPGLVPAFSAGFLYLATETNLDSQQGTYIIDLESREPIGKIPHKSGIAARRVVTSPDGRYVYVCSFQGRICAETAANKVVAEFEEVWISARGGMSFSPDGTLMHFVFRTIPGPYYLETVHTGTFDSVGRITLSSLGLGEIDVGPGQTPVVTGPDDRVYVGINIERTWGAVAQVDLRDREVRQVFRIPDAGLMRDLTLSPDGTVLHVAHLNGVAALDVRNGAILRQGLLPTCSWIELTPDGSELYCGPVAQGQGLLVADPADHGVRHRIPIKAGGGPGTPRGVAFSHRGEFAYVTEDETYQQTSIAIVDTAEHRKIASIPLSRDITRLDRVAYAPY